MHLRLRDVAAKTLLPLLRFMEDTTDSRLLSTFEKGPEFLNYLNTFLEVDVSSETTMTPLEDEAFKQLCAIVRNHISYVQRANVALVG